MATAEKVSKHMNERPTVKEMAAALKAGIEKLEGPERWTAHEAYGYFVIHHLKESD